MRLVLIEWEDSRKPVADWVWLNELTLSGVVKCSSVGWLVTEGEEMVVLAPNVGDLNSGEDQQAAGLIRIPSRSIIRMAELKVKKTKKEKGDG